MQGGNGPKPRTFYGLYYRGLELHRQGIEHQKEDFPASKILPSPSAICWHYPPFELVLWAEGIGGLYLRDFLWKKTK